MRTMKLLFAIACLLGLLATSFAQNAETGKSSGVFGYMDPKTGLFHSLNRTPLAIEPEAITPTTGKFVFNVTITVSSALPTTAVIECLVSGGVVGDPAGTFTNTVTVTATRSGNTATCTLNVPYSWDLTTPTKDVVAFDLAVTASAGSPASASFYEETFTAPAITTKVPATGTTTTETIATTI